MRAEWLTPYWKTLITLFFVGWVTYIFSFVNVGSISLTLMLLVSALFVVESSRSSYLFSLPFVFILVSTLTAWSASIIMHGGIGRPTVHFLQAVLALGVLTVSSSINWRIMFNWVQKNLLVIAAISLVYSVYQFFARSSGFPFAFLPVTNAQIASDAGFQRGYVKGMGDIGFNRVSAFFAEPADLGRYMLWVFCFTVMSGSRLIRVLGAGIAVAGVLISQSFGAVLSLIFIVIVLTVTFRSYRLFFRISISIAGVFCLTLIIFPEVIGVIYARMQKIVLGGIYSLSFTGRFRDLSDGWEMILAQPLLGYGLASIGTLMKGKILSDSYTIVIFERGIIGAFFFFTPFFFSSIGLFLRRDLLLKDQVFRAAYLVGVVEIFFFFTFGQIYFAPLYFSLGFQVYCLRNMNKGSYNDSGKVVV